MAERKHLIITASITGAVLPIMEIDLNTLPEFKKTIIAIHSLLDNRDSLYQSRIDRLNNWEPADTEIEDTVLGIMEEILDTPNGQAYQSLIGRIAPMINIEHPLDQAKIAGEVIGLAIVSDLLDLEYSQEYERYWVTTQYEKDDEWIPEKHQPFTQIPKVTDPILGHKLSKGICTCKQHLKSLNAIPLVLAVKVIKAIREKPTFELDTDEKEAAWKLHLGKSKQTYINTVQKDKFYLEHAVDTRGRTYCRGYYINYQGTSYKKAIVQLANKEIVNL